jgi:hypothetical protein
MNADSLRRLLRRILVVALVAAGLLLGIGVAAGFSRALVYLALSCVGLATGAILAYVDLGAIRLFPKTARAALGLVISSQVCFHLLVWTGWVREPLLWRLWWAAVVGSITSAHLIGIRMPGPAPRDRVNSITEGGALLSGAWLASLAFLPAFPPQNLPTPYLALFAPPALASIAGTIVLWRRRMKRADGTQTPLAPWARVSWIVGAFLATFMGGWYVGGAGKGSSLEDALPSALSGLTREEVESAVNADLERFRRVAAGLDELAERVKRLQTEIEARQKAENRTVYLPEEDDRIRAAFMTYLSYRSALRRIVATYAGFRGVRDPELRARCFTLGAAAMVTAMENAVAFVKTYRDNPNARRKLNEAEEAWGLSAGTFDQIYDSVTNEEHQERYQEVVAFYDEHRAAWAGPDIWPPETFAWLDGRMAAGRAFVLANPLSGTRAWFSKLTRQVKRDVGAPVYVMQSHLSTLIGDARVVSDEPLITLDQIRTLRSRLKPGDIVLERRNWYLSNAFLPGFWPHAALYVGTPEDLKRLGLDQDPDVRRRAAEHAKADEHGETPTILEAVSEGVILNTLSHSMHADHVVVFRPRLTEKQIAEAIRRAFTHHGKAYDFEFDFFTSDKLVCTEVVYRAYEGMLKFNLVRVMGRDTLPALEIVKKWDRERAAGKPEMDFVLFLDGDRKAGVAREADEAALSASVDRPAAFGR